MDTSLDGPRDRVTTDFKAATMIVAWEPGSPAENTKCEKNRMEILEPKHLITKIKTTVWTQ